MPHMRKRHIEMLLAQISGLSPLIGVLGHRQVGKTTLLEKMGSHYQTFDDAQTLQTAEANPKLFLSQFSKTGTVIDGCQLCPQIFPALIERVRTDKRPGQFFYQDRYDSPAKN